jgi:hypothetical protein
MINTVLKRASTTISVGSAATGEVLALPDIPEAAAAVVVVRRECS